MRMNERGLRQDLLMFNLLLIFLLAVVAVVLIYFSGGAVLLLFGLFAALIFTMLVSYNLGLQKGLLVSILCTFLYGSYVIHQVLVTQKIQQVEFSHVIWIFLFPLGGLLAGRFAAIVSMYHWELNNAKSLKSLVTIDGSTGFYNNQGFFKKLDEEFQRAQRYQTDFSILLLKIANFNEIRLVYGEVDAGKILKSVAEITNMKVRFSDIKGLLDDDVLSVLLIETNAMQAKIVVEKLHEALHTVTADVRGSRKVIKIKPSIGAASNQKGDTDVIEMYERAREEVQYDKG